MENFNQIILTVIATVCTGLASWLVIVITNWINKKVKDEKLAKILTAITKLIMDVVQKAMQTTVDTLKKQGKFTAKAAAEVKEKVVAEIIAQLTVEQAEYIRSITDDIKVWISSQVEVMVYQLKHE